MNDLPEQFSLYTELEPSKWPLHLYFYGEAFFSKVAFALQQISKHLIVEVSVCDIVQYMEGLRRTPNELVTNSATRTIHTFQGFDRIYLSNIPDYVGGSLFLSLFVAPLLKAHKEAFATANCFRNPSQWPKMLDYDSEHLALPDQNSVTKGLGLFWRGSWETEEDDSTSSYMSKSMFGLPRLDYQMWSTMPHIARPYDKLLTKTQLTRWLH